MEQKLYVGNLPLETKERELYELFSPFGEVEEIKIQRDRYTGAPRGFAFVKMREPDALSRVIEILDGKLFKGNHLSVHIGDKEHRTEEEKILSKK